MLRQAARSLLSKPKPKFPKPIISQPFKSLIIPTTPPKKSHLSNPIITATISRPFSSSVPAADVSKEIDEIHLKFVEAREEIDAAMESKETVYFDEEAECAREAVKVVMDMYDGLLKRLDEKERVGLQRSMGLKMEQLKAELSQLHDDD